MVRALTLKALARMAADYNKSGHSIFGPSSSAMWLYCSGSLIANLTEPDSSSFEAAEGTVAHGVGEEWLKTGKRPLHLVGTSVTVNERDGKTYVIPITHTMLDFVQEYVDWCDMLEGQHYVETKAFFSEYMPIPDQGGTADHAACLPGKLVITDFKYGKGVEVHAEENTQGLLYALGFFLKYDHLYHFEEIEIRICQPRMGIYDTWTVDREYLLNFAEYVRVRAARAWQLNAPRRVSPKGCMWCRVKGRCPAMLKVMDAIVEGRFNDIDREYTQDELDVLLSSFERGKYTIRPIAVDKLTATQMAKIRPYRRLLESWFKNLDDHAERMAIQGEVIPGHKLVESRTYRNFKSEEAAVKQLQMIGLEQHEIFKQELISPAEAEELIREKFPQFPKKLIPELVNDAVDRPRGRPTLVLLSDRRPEFNQDLDDLLMDDSDMFDDDEFDI